MSVLSALGESLTIGISFLRRIQRDSEELSKYHLGEHPRIEN